MSGKLLGQLEKFLLGLLKFNVSLSGSEYAKFYFELRDMSPKAFAAHDTPLTDDEIARLEERSSDSARWQAAKAGARRPPAVSQSANFATPPGKKRELVVDKMHDPAKVVAAASTQSRWAQHDDVKADEETRAVAVDDTNDEEASDFTESE
eukprot:TRINITY_DN3303_c0_g1_i2.p1 TRINITY_DN3303_c0_g1~~TRINITY_DN3303_c0_g1_i2.p1  ORF type:complete len:151 (-),score=57.62 TRINITY_DN3303_c0_g1_i2:11-463(-)